MRHTRVGFPVKMDVSSRLQINSSSTSGVKASERPVRRDPAHRMTLAEGGAAIVAAAPAPMRNPRRDKGLKRSIHPPERRSSAT
jgi:hypothetical protein